MLQGFQNSQSIYILIKVWSSCLLDCLRPCVDSIIQGLNRPVMEVSSNLGPDTQRHLSPTYLSVVHVTTVRPLTSSRVYTQNSD